MGCILYYPRESYMPLHVSYQRDTKGLYRIQGDGKTEAVLKRRGTAPLLRSLEGHGPANTLNNGFGLLVSRTVREQASFVLRHRRCADLLWQSQGTSTLTNDLGESNQKWRKPDQCATRGTADSTRLWSVLAITGAALPLLRILNVLRVITAALPRIIHLKIFTLGFSKYPFENPPPSYPPHVFRSIWLSACFFLIKRNDEHPGTSFTEISLRLDQRILQGQHSWC